MTLKIYRQFYTRDMMHDDGLKMRLKDEFII